MSFLGTVISAISTVSGNFVTRCPRCSAKMKRERSTSKRIQRPSRPRGGLRSAARTGGMRYAGRTVQIVPVFDVCLGCRYKVRLKNQQLG
jgi:molybdenum cofactor biosynthesis enzyme